MAFSLRPAAGVGAVPSIWTSSFDMLVLPVSRPSRPRCSGLRTRPRRLELQCGQAICPELGHVQEHVLPDKDFQVPTLVMVALELFEDPFGLLHAQPFT